MTAINFYLRSKIKQQIHCGVPKDMCKRPVWFCIDKTFLHLLPWFKSNTVHVSVDFMHTNEFKYTNTAIRFKQLYVY